MEARQNPHLRIRRESFGGICYIPHRDDFFALDKNVFGFVRELPSEWTNLQPAHKGIASALAKLGICETRQPATREIAYSGPSFVGQFREIVTLPQPLVVNCFATAFCPLKCVYCHADDLMKGYRDAERDEHAENVASTVSLIPAMVAVITGGDPLTRPERARVLIERLSPQKAIVLDTSGVGDIRPLIPLLKEHHAHVRVSLDAVTDVNAKLRRTNKAFNTSDDASFHGAKQTIIACKEGGVSVTVQTVVTAMNEDLSELRTLRQWLVDVGVKHWVLHLTVKGGIARKIDNVAQKKMRPRSIFPSEMVHERIKALMAESRSEKVPLDIRCTDTGSTPNSVLLVGSNGDLFTEGLAHDGKVKLFGASDARPDRIREFWYHIDQFGHARRYLNWNPWLYEGESLEDICFPVPEFHEGTEIIPGLVETEAKFRVKNIEKLVDLLGDNADKTEDEILQRDEYYDTHNKALAGQDFVVRKRSSGDRIEIGLKGPRFRTEGGEHSRIEIEFTPISEEQFAEELGRRHLECTWFFEKRRTSYQWKASGTKLVVDEIPEIGFYLEIEGTLTEIRTLEKALKTALGEKETRNYKELFVAFKEKASGSDEVIRGAEFVPA